MVSIALLAAGCGKDPPPAPIEELLVQEPIQGPRFAALPGETLVAAWNDTRPYVNLRTEIVQIEGGSFELRRSAIDVQGRPGGQELVEVDVATGRRFNLADGRSDYFELLEDGTARVGDQYGVIYTEETLAQ
jgi:hypothetical protein